MVLYLVSVPLSGLVSINRFDEELPVCNNVVSVPLSGLVSINQSAFMIYQSLVIQVSVPLSGLVSINKLRVSNSPNLIQVSVPLSGLVSINNGCQCTGKW